MDNSQQQFSVKGLLKSFGFAAQGIVFVVKNQRNMFLHILAAIFVCILGLWLEVNASDWRWLLLCIGLVWFSELMNSAFEYVCDVVMPDKHESVKRAKDIAAGAVLVCACVAALIGLITLWPYLQ